MRDCRPGAFISPARRRSPAGDYWGINETEKESEK